MNFPCINFSVAVIVFILSCPESLDLLVSLAGACGLIYLFAFLAVVFWNSGSLVSLYANQIPEFVVSSVNCASR